MIKEVNNDVVFDIICNYFKVKNPFTIYSKVFIYEEDNHLMGILVYDEIYDRIEIDYILVFEEYKRNGIGKKLLTSLKNSNISLEVRKSNVVAIQFYKSCGFEIVAERKNYYGKEDGYLMCKVMS